MQMGNYRAKHVQLDAIMTTFQKTQIFVFRQNCPVLLFHNPESETLNTSMNILQVQSATSPCLLNTFA